MTWITLNVLLSHKTISVSDISVGDPDPRDPHVFGPPGSGSFPFLTNALSRLK
jgi:hypothetical protein